MIEQKCHPMINHDRVDIGIIRLSNDEQVKRASDAIALVTRKALEFYGRVAVYGNAFVAPIVIAQPDPKDASSWQTNLEFCRVGWRAGPSSHPRRIDRFRIASLEIRLQPALELVVLELFHAHGLTI